jgi:acetate---CoA ligase (ADP-forming)
MRSAGSGWTDTGSPPVRELTGAEPDVAALLDPGSVAVVGASSRPGTLSWWPLHLLAASGYTGGIYPINPNRDEIDGIRCYPSLAELPGPVDVAIIALDAERTLEAMDDCRASGVRAVVLPTQGFGELGPAGRERQERLRSFTGPGKLRIVGPNTDGVANLATGAIASIQPLFGQGMRSGAVAVATQSGATAASLMARLRREGIGCRFYASAGNEADLGLADFLSVMVQDPEVRIVLSFVEAVRRPGHFLAVAELAADLGKPIALIKIGRSEQGARRAAAHTGALAGSDEIYDALFRRYGVIRVGELGELVAVAKLFLARGAPRSRAIGIMSVSGGQAGAIADQAARLGLSVPPLSPSAEAALDAALEFGSGFNPCDLTGAVATDHGLAARVHGVFDEAPSVDTVIYARKSLTGRAGIEAARHLAGALAPVAATPLAVYAMDGTVEGEEAEIYERADIPVFASVSELGAAIGGLADWAQTRDREPGGRATSAAPTPPDREPGYRATSAAPTTPEAPGDRVAAGEGGIMAGEGGIMAGEGGIMAGEGGVVDAPTTVRLLAAYGIPTAAQVIAHSEQEAVSAAQRLGFPVVLKVVSDLIPHKTEAGGVALGLADADAVRTAYAEIRRRARKFLGDELEPDGVLVQEQLRGGTEMMVGAKVDPAFGAFVVVGTGGILTELLADVTVAPAPVDETEALAMIRRLRGAELLRGYRGAPAGDVPALAAVVSRFSQFAADHTTTLYEADLNPVVVLPEGRGVYVADALLIARGPDVSNGRSG